MAQMNEKETTDEVIQETRRIKEALAASMDFDIDRILDDGGPEGGCSTRPEESLSPAFRTELDRRLADHKANPDDTVPWEEFKAAALARMKQ
jgi:hypothetical protein